MFKTSDFANFFIFLVALKVLHRPFGHMFFSINVRVDIVLSLN